jgi:hypothetical protein
MAAGKTRQTESLSFFNRTGDGKSGRPDSRCFRPDLTISLFIPFCQLLPFVCLLTAKG